jgi:hypothetical protein
MYSSYDYICVLLAQICWSFQKLWRKKGARVARMVGFHFNTIFNFFSPYSFAFTLLEFFLLYKKFTPSSTTSSNVTKAVKTSWKVFLLWLSCFLHYILCHINIILFFSQANLLLFFLFCIIWLQVTTILDFLPLCNHYYILCLFAKGQTKNLKGLRRKNNLPYLRCDTHHTLWCTTHY